MDVMSSMPTPRQLVVIAAGEAGGMGLSLLALAVAGMATWWQARGRETLRRLWDRRRHPARTARLVAAAAAMVGGGGMTVILAADSEARPDPPQGSAVIVGSEVDGPRPATFVLINDVPGDQAEPAEVTSSGASF